MIEKIGAHINETGFLRSLFNHEDQTLFKNGSVTSSFVEFSAISEISEIKLCVTEIDKECNVVTEHVWEEMKTKEIRLLCLDNKFGIFSQ